MLAAVVLADADSLFQRLLQPKADSYREWFEAVRVDDVRRVQSLLARGFDANSVEPERFDTALIVSVRLKSSKVFSSIKSNLNISLKSMYAMGNQNNFSVKRAPSTSMTHTVITYHKGNQTWVMPYKNNIKILGRFKTPSR
jgi:hypothetical protein